MKTANASGVIRHEIHWDGKIPVRVTLWLKGGAEVSVDVITAAITEKYPASLTAEKRSWAVAIAGYLVRQELLRQIQERSGQNPEEANPLEFNPKPDGQQIWWG
ncbi:MAG: hypothetical protein HQL73_09430 [Magnetococcales bacterium]|nr:hypothetical protein [Magnetococcales bacterium]